METYEKMNKAFEEFIKELERREKIKDKIHENPFMRRWQNETKIYRNRKQRNRISDIACHQ